VFLFQFSHRLFRAGLILATGPPGLGSIAIFASFPFSTRHWDAGVGGMIKTARWVLWNPTQAQKTGLDPDFLPHCAKEIRVCAFH
jgi:hypothetical protein